MQRHGRFQAAICRPLRPVANHICSLLRHLPIYRRLCEFLRYQQSLYLTGDISLRAARVVTKGGQSETLYMIFLGIDYEKTVLNKDSDRLYKHAYRLDGGVYLRARLDHNCFAATDSFRWQVLAQSLNKSEYLKSQTCTSSLTRRSQLPGHLWRFEILLVIHVPSNDVFQRRHSRVSMRLYRQHILETEMPLLGQVSNSPRHGVLCETNAR